MEDWIVGLGIILVIIMVVTIYFYRAKEEESPLEEHEITKKEENYLMYTSHLNYKVHEFDEFLTSEECDRIIELSRENLVESRVYSGFDAEDLYETASRKSEQCWLDDNDDPLIASISQKVKDLTNTHDNHQEKLQVVNYQKGGFFSPHYDACDGTPEYCSRMNGKEGPRYYTLLIYLNDDFEGGETVFPKINKFVKPKKGKAVLFQSVDHRGVIIDEAFHGGNPVSAGQKWIANKWIRLYS
jgi:prolyl 4-hydroxylase